MTEFYRGWSGLIVDMLMLMLWFCALADVFFTFTYFELKALVGYSVAFGAVMWCMIAVAGSLPPVSEHILSYTVLLLFAVIPLGNVLNLGWLLSPRFRNAYC